MLLGNGLGNILYENQGAMPGFGDEYRWVVRGREQKLAFSWGCFQPVFADQHWTDAFNPDEIGGRDVFFRSLRRTHRPCRSFQRFRSCP